MNLNLPVEANDIVRSPLKQSNNKAEEDAVVDGIRYCDSSYVGVPTIYSAIIGSTSFLALLITELTFSVSISSGGYGINSF
jgi:hypothetical protein